MKKHSFMIIVAIALLYSPVGAFAQEKADSSAKGVIGSMPEGAHINAFRVDNIIDSGVINIEGKRIGTIDDLVIDTDTGSVMYAVLELGGFMGFGDKLFAVPWHSLTSVPAEGIFILDQSKAKLEKAPGFDKDNWPDLGDLSWGGGIYEFYRHHVPSPKTSAAPAAPQKQKMLQSYRQYPGYPEGGYPSTWTDPFGEIFNAKTVESVTGIILKIEYYESIRLLIYTDAKKPVLVALGPPGYFEGQTKILIPGNTVTVTGSKVIVDDTPFMIATKIKEGNEELQMRDKEGHPVWMGWKTIK